LLVKNGVASGHKFDPFEYFRSCQFQGSPLEGKLRRITEIALRADVFRQIIPTKIVRLFILKPDGIGDFVLVTGALRFLAAQFGEQNLLICVQSVLVSLARAQFPQATVLELPTAAERKVINLFARNFFFCLPLWFRLRRTRVDCAVCFRSMRNYLETFLFYSARTKRFFACENILLRPEKKVRSAVENGARRLFRPEMVAYPGKVEGVPLEIEAHRRLVARILDRPVEASDVLPVLHPTLQKKEGCWICAPVTSPSKVYPFPLWKEVFCALKPETLTKKILLVGSEDQFSRLNELKVVLMSAGIAGAEAVVPGDLVELLNLIAGAELILTVDTAAAHFATALDKSCVVLFSGLHQGMFGPWRRSARQRWLLPEAPPGKTKFKWHAGISPVRAAAEVRDLMRNLPPGTAAAHNSCWR
jgi:ADP-heptose:LPS heptosyltransferase